MVTGGLRKRLIKDNLYFGMYNSLDSLGWFSNTLSEYPVELLTEQIDPLIEIKPNKVGISSEDITNTEMELGSNLSEDSWEIYFDIFGENEAVSIHLSGDIYDILRGKISGGLDRLNVYDLTQVGQPFLFSCDIEEVEIARVREWERPYNKYWWVVGCLVRDSYYGEGA